MELVFNEPTWLDSGLPVNNDDCGCTGEEPLVPPTINYAPAANQQCDYDLDAPLVPPVLNFSEPIPHSFDRSGISPVVGGGSPSADSQYGLSAPPRFDDNYEEHLAEQHRENKKKLGLLDEGEGEPLVAPSTTDAIIRDSRERTQQAARASFAGR